MARSSPMIRSLVSGGWRSARSSARFARANHPSDGVGGRSEASLLVGSGVGVEGHDEGVRSTTKHPARVDAVGLDFQGGTHRRGAAGAPLRSGGRGTASGQDPLAELIERGYTAAGGQLLGQQITKCVNRWQLSPRRSLFDQRSTDCALVGS